MTSDAALRVSGTTVAEGRGEPGRGARRPERHLRVLPPPAAYAVAPARERAALRPAAGAAPAPRLRLTARGRRLASALALALGVGVVALGDAILGAGEGDGLELMGTSSVVVERGDTLWSIARSVTGDRDVREVIDGIQALNGLDGAEISPAQVLQVP